MKNVHVEPVRVGFKPKLYTGTIEALPDEIRELYCSKYELDEETLKQSCGWSPEYQRTVWPVYSPTGALRGYELRSLNPADRFKTLHFRHQAGVWAGYTTASGRRPGYIVLVEDLISAACVSSAGYVAVSLMGTNLDLEKILELVATYPDRDTLLCLDRDATTKAIEKTERWSFLRTIRPVALMRDLKYENKKIIGEIVEGGYSGNIG